MFEIIKARLRQKHRTIAFPKKPPTLPDRFRGLPVIEPVACESDCAACKNICPTEAIGSTKDGELKIDMGKCVFCGTCSAACPASVIRFGADYRLAANSASDLAISVVDKAPRLKPLAAEKLSLFKRSFNIRVVSAGGCNACEADINVLSTIVFDLSRFGINYVASPRHADAILVAGPVPRTMQAALIKTYNAIPDPKIVIAVGACAISGGLFSGLGEACGGATPHIPVDLFIPGCPPHPITILDGLLRFLHKRK
jgi:Ni,Fe-hydrogenase III small subunit/formate hydrogenlyase subunit 6/NADH:ubiquinone oxidoreductase subunit I